MFSLAIERVGGLAYAKASSNDDSVSVFTIGVGVGTVNPYALPRVGVDYVLKSGLTLGAALGVARWSASATSNSASSDVGSITLYTLTPRIGYRLALTPHIDFTPRLGGQIVGGSVSNGAGSADASVFSFGIGADAPFAFRITDSFHILAGPAIDVTLTASASASNGGSGSSSSSDIDASFWSLQGWLGMGGYL
jgi:hypothetical protein